MRPGGEQHPKKITHTLINYTQQNVTTTPLIIMNVYNLLYTNYYILRELLALFCCGAVQAGYAHIRVAERCHVTCNFRI